jgi:hypothetical protein
MYKNKKRFLKKSHNYTKAICKIAAKTSRNLLSLRGNFELFQRHTIKICKISFKKDVSTSARNSGGKH